MSDVDCYNITTFDLLYNTGVNKSVQSISDLTAMKHSARSVQSECNNIKELLVDVGNALGLQGEVDHGKSKFQQIYFNKFQII